MNCKNGKKKSDISVDNDTNSNESFKLNRKLSRIFLQFTSQAAVTSCHTQARLKGNNLTLVITSEK